MIFRDILEFPFQKITTSIINLLDKHKNPKKLDLTLKVQHVLWKTYLNILLLFLN